MTHTANHAVPKPGKIRRALAAVWAFLQTMESTSFDYTSIASSDWSGRWDD
jgi:hypothetical protein